MKKCFFFFLLLVSTFCLGQDRKVELEISGAKKYKELYIRSNQLNNVIIKFSGKTLDGTNWAFIIPDSIVKKTRDFDFSGLPENDKRNDFLDVSQSGNKKKPENQIEFLGAIQGDTLRGFYINFEKDEQLIQLKMKYDHTDLFVNKQYDESLKKTVIIEEYDEDYFLIDSISNQYLKENMADLFFGFFRSEGGYEGNLADMVSKIKKNPNSMYYLTRLAATTNFYRTKSDLEKLYHLFSDEMQHSYFGQIIYNNFSTFDIANISLTNCDTKKEERIVENPDKYTLLIFSASWCGPCRKKIPMLKKIYKEMSKTLDMVYITIDDEKMLPQWEKLMRTENIPWRSLSLNNNKELKDAWNIGAIPDYILINPDWKARKISLNDENDINILYSFVLNRK